MIRTGLVFKLAKKEFPTPLCEVCVGTTQQYQTTVNIHFQEFQKVHLNKTKNPFYYNQISR